MLCSEPDWVDNTSKFLPNGPFNHVDEPGHDEPLPEVGSVEEYQNPERHVQQMSPVKNLKNR